MSACAAARGQQLPVRQHGDSCRRVVGRTVQPRECQISLTGPTAAYCTLLTHAICGRYKLVKSAHIRKKGNTEKGKHTLRSHHSRRCGRATETQAYALGPRGRKRGASSARDVDETVRRKGYAPRQPRGYSRWATTTLGQLYEDGRGRARSGQAYEERAEAPEVASR